MFDWLKGYKTYLVAIAAGVAAAANAMGYPIPEWVLIALAGAGGAALRAAK